VFVVTSTQLSSLYPKTTGCWVNCLVYIRRQAPFKQKWCTNPQHICWESTALHDFQKEERCVLRSHRIPPSCNKPSPSEEKYGQPHPLDTTTYEHMSRICRCSKISCKLRGYFIISLFVCPDSRKWRVNTHCVQSQVPKSSKVHEFGFVSPLGEWSNRSSAISLILLLHRNCQKAVKIWITGGLKEPYFIHSDL